MLQGFPPDSPSASGAAKGPFSRWCGTNTPPSDTCMIPHPHMIAVLPRQGADGQLLSVHEMPLAHDGAGDEGVRIAADLPGYHSNVDRAHQIEAHREYSENQQSPNVDQTYRVHGSTGAAHPIDGNYSDEDADGFASPCIGEPSGLLPGFVRDNPLAGWCTCQACGKCFSLTDGSIQTHLAECACHSSPGIISPADDKAKPAAAAGTPPLEYDTPLPGWCTCGTCRQCFSLDSHGSAVESIQAHFSRCTVKAAVERSLGSQTATAGDGRGFPKCSSRIQAHHPHGPGRAPLYFVCVSPLVINIPQRNV